MGEAKHIPVDSELIGKSLANKVFAHRSGKGARRAEIHIGEEELAILLAASFELGVEASRAAIARATGTQADKEQGNG